MGCDIHTSLVEYDPKWNSYYSLGDNFLRDRNYRLFAHLAGVRNYHEPVVPDGEFIPPRGLPSWWQKRDVVMAGNGDGPEGCEHGDHSFSWLTLAELRAVADKFEKRIPDEPGTPKAIRAICDYAEVAGFAREGLQKFFVFSFDS